MSKIIKRDALRKVVLFIFSTVSEITWGITLLSLQIVLRNCISVKNNTLRLVAENYKRKSSI